MTLQTEQPGPELPPKCPLLRTAASRCGKDSYVGQTEIHVPQPHFTEHPPSSGLQMVLSFLRSSIIVLLYIRILEHRVVV